MRSSLWLAIAALSACTASVSRPTPAGLTGRLVVSNMSDNTATVLDVASGVVVATLLTGTGPHEVAVSHDGRWALVSNYGVRGQPGNSVTVIDVPAARVARTIALDRYTRPHGIAFLPGDSVFAVTSETNQAVVLVAFQTGSIIRAIPTKGRGSHMLGLAGPQSRIVTGNIADATVSILDGGGEGRLVRVDRQPEGIALSPDGRTIWVGSNADSTVTAVDAEGGAVLGKLRGFGLPYRIAVTPDGDRVVVTDPVRAQVRAFDATSRAELFVTQVPADSLVATAEVAGSPSPEGIAISRDSRWAFVTLQGRNRVATIDLRTGAIVRYAPTGNWSDGIGYSPIR